MILISQVTSSIKTDMYEKSPNRGGEFSGGNCLLHSADWILEYQRTSRRDYIYDTPNGEWSKENPHAKAIGRMAKVTLVKSAIETNRYQTIEYPIKSGRKPSGIWLEKEIIDKLMSLGLITRKGSWLSWEPSLLSDLRIQFPDIKDTIQGEHKMTEYLEENPNIRDFLYPKVLAFSKTIYDSTK